MNVEPRGMQDRKECVWSQNKCRPAPLESLLLETRMKCVQVQRSQACLPAVRMPLVKPESTSKWIMLNSDIKLRGQLRQNLCS